MFEEKDQTNKKLVARDIREGYQPTKGNLDSSNPPKGGSGVPSKGNSDKKD
ncbi:MAG: hypothetical protein ACE5IR_00655 [bacterium]